MSDTTDKFPCSSCGADLEFKPGTNSLTCPYCGAMNEIGGGDSTVIEEKDFQSVLEKLRSQEASGETVDTIITKCDTCGAEVNLGENRTGGECVFCGSNIVAQGKSVKALKPESLLPFKISKQEAADRFRQWLSRRWFAPGKLKKFARPDGLKGLYTPYWTYDAGTVTDYTGQRGDYYYTTETYTQTVDGKQVTKTRQVRHTRWTPARGTVSNEFDDVLVHAASGMEEDRVQQLEPWDLENLVPWNSSYLSGFQVESYSVDLEEGLSRAKERMRPVIESAIRRDIGGDTQQIHHMNTAYSRIKFKHVLLPVWISSYRFRDKVYQFLVNARTGEVQGSRPYSAGKIILLVAVLLVLAGAGFWLYRRYGG